MEQKQIDKGKTGAVRNNEHSVIETMKPFVTFGLKAMAFLGTALVHIVKHIPKPNSDKPTGKNDRVIKI